MVSGSQPGAERASGSIPKLPVGVLVQTPGLLHPALPPSPGWRERSFLNTNKLLQFFIICFHQATCLHARLLLFGALHYLTFPYVPSQLTVVQSTVVNPSTCWLVCQESICLSAFYMTPSIRKHLVTFNPSNKHRWQLRETPISG